MELTLRLFKPKGKPKEHPPILFGDVYPRRPNPPKGLQMYIYFQRHWCGVYVSDEEYVKMYLALRKEIKEN